MHYSLSLCRTGSPVWAGSLVCHCAPAPSRRPPLQAWFSAPLHPKAGGRGPLPQEAMGFRTIGLAPPPGVPTPAGMRLCTASRLDGTLGRGCTCLVLTPPPHTHTHCTPLSSPGAQQGSPQLQLRRRWAAGGGPAAELHRGCGEGRGGWQRPLPSGPLPETLPAASRPSPSILHRQRSPPRPPPFPAPPSALLSFPPQPSPPPLPLLRSPRLPSPLLSSLPESFSLASFLSSSGLKIINFLGSRGSC